MSDIAPCRLLSWDSEFFGFPVAAIQRRRLSPPLAAEVIAWCCRHRVRCAYFWCDGDDPQTLRTAAAHDFDLVDVRITLEKQLSGHAAMLVGSAAAQSSLRPAKPEDLPALAAIARSSYRDSRFHFDGRFPREKCDMLYARWIEDCCRQQPDGVIVAEAGGQPVGYVTCDAAAGRIGLLGVEASARCAGLGQRLVEAALRWFAERGTAQVVAATPVRNLAAQRLYQECGFLTTSVELIYHRWFDTCV